MFMAWKLVRPGTLPASGLGRPCGSAWAGGLRAVSAALPPSAVDAAAQCLGSPPVLLASPQPLLSIPGPLSASQSLLGTQARPGVENSSRSFCWALSKRCAWAAERWFQDSHLAPSLRGKKGARVKVPVCPGLPRALDHCASPHAASQDSMSFQLLSSSYSHSSSPCSSAKDDSSLS